MKSSTDTSHISRQLSHHDPKTTPRTSTITVALPARPPIPPIAIPAVSSDTKEKLKTHRHHTHRVTEQPAVEKRPIEQLVSEVDAFVMDVSKSNVHNMKDDKDQKMVDLQRLTTIKNSLQMVASDYEKRPEFKVIDKMSARKIELDKLIAAADKAYAEKQQARQTAVEALDVKLDELHRHLTEIQGQTLIAQFKNMELLQYYNNKIRDEVASINDAIDGQACCSRIFCSCWPSEAIVKQQKQLKMLHDDQDALAGNDVTKLSTVLSARIEADRQELIKQRETLAKDQPQETAQKLRDERTKLQADIDVGREAYYHTISPQVMLNLVRLQSFLGRMQKKVNNAKTAAESNGDTVKTGLLHVVSVLINTFLKKFNDMCGGYVCRPPQNEDNAISYAQYCERFHKLKDEEKRLLINGPPPEEDKKHQESMQKIQQLDESIFSEHKVRINESDSNTLPPEPVKPPSTRK